ncbi:MAG: H+transporting two-sector ATPase subunit [Tardiphaga sp.]|nr:H+transporting two-sector ATPase subunit [Tardiphaga sp.]MDB5549498.1 H+transporting two-sector ATPase subunit [Tardiphaga sp.]
MATGQSKSGTTAHSAADGGHKAEFPPFNKDTFASQLVSFAIAFALLYLIVSRFALPRVGGILATRQAAIDTDLNEAARLRDESDKALKAYETELADARAKAQAIANDVRDKLNAEQEQLRKSLDERLAAQLVEAEKTIAVTRQSAMGNVRAIAAEAATAIVERLTGSNPNAGAVNAALDASLKG